MSRWLSVLMPVYNGARYLEAALASIVAQGEPNLEVIAVDDASQDDSVAILESYADRLELRVVQQPHQGNWVASTNHALSLARGEFVSFLHQDDVWERGRLSRLRSLANDYPAAGMLFHPAYYLDARGGRLGLWTSPLIAGEHPPGLLVEPLLVQNFIAIPTPIVRREVAERVGGLDERLWYTADWDFWMKVAEIAPVVYEPTPLAGFRIHAESQTVRRSSQGDEFREQLLAAYEPHAARWLAAHPNARAHDRVGRFSMEVNVALARLAHGVPARLGRLGWQFARLGPAGWWRYYHDSRILQRVRARLKLKTEHRAATP